MSTAAFRVKLTPAAKSVLAVLVAKPHGLSRETIATLRREGAQVWFASEYERAAWVRGTSNALVRLESAGFVFKRRGKNLDGSDAPWWLYYATHEGIEWLADEALRERERRERKGKRG